MRHSIKDGRWCACVCVVGVRERAMYIWMSVCLYATVQQGFSLMNLHVVSLSINLTAHQLPIREYSGDSTHCQSYQHKKKSYKSNRATRDTFFFFQWAPAGISLLISLWELVEIRSECLRPLCALLSTSQNGYSMNVSQNTNYEIIYMMCSVKQSATHLHTS